MIDLRPANEVRDSRFQKRVLYSPSELWGLALSILDKRSEDDPGIRINLLGRPDPDDPSRVELAYGHRRKRAAIIATLIDEEDLTEEAFLARHMDVDLFAGAAAAKTLLPVKIEPLTDAEMIEAQGLENLQRSAPNAMEVADYLELCMRPEPEGLGDSLRDVVARVRKPLGYVQKHLALLALPPEARNALYDERQTGFTEEYAFAVARIPTPKMRTRAFNAIMGDSEARGHRRYVRDDEDEMMFSLVDAKRWIARNCMLPLAPTESVPFDMTNADLVPGRPACGPCDERSGNQRALFDDVPEESECQNVECYHAKTRAQAALDAAALKLRLLPDDETEKAFDGGRLRYGGKYADLDEAHYIGMKQKPLRDLFGKDQPKIILATPGGVRHELVLKSDAERVIASAKKEHEQKARQRSTSSSAKTGPVESAERAEEKIKAETATAFRLTAFSRVIASWPKDPPLELVRILVLHALNDGYGIAEDEILRALGVEVSPSPTRVPGANGGALDKHIGALTSKRELYGVLAAFIFHDALTRSVSDDKLLKTLAEHTDVDLEVVKREVSAQFSDRLKKARKKKADAKGKPAAKKGKSKGGKKRAKVDIESLDTDDDGAPFEDGEPFTPPVPTPRPTPPTRFAAMPADQLADAREEVAETVHEMLDLEELDVAELIDRVAEATAFHRDDVKARLEELYQDGIVGMIEDTDRLENLPEREPIHAMKCAGCGCTDAEACAESCSWVTPGWCSSCEALLEEAIKLLKRTATEWIEPALTTAMIDSEVIEDITEDRVRKVLEHAAMAGSILRIEGGLVHLPIKGKGHPLRRGGKAAKPAPAPKQQEFVWLVALTNIAHVPSRLNEKKSVCGKVNLAKAKVAPKDARRCEGCRRMADSSGKLA